MIIDIHAHTTNHKLWNLHTPSATIEDLERLAEKNGVVKILLMATYFPFKGSGLHNEELLARIGDKKLGLSTVRGSVYGNNGPLFAVCGSLNMMDNVELGVMRLRRLAEDKKIVGIKLYPGYQDFKPSGVLAFPVYELAEKFDLPVIFHSGYLHHCCRQEEVARRCGRPTCPLDSLEYLSRPSQLYGAAQKFPRVKFVAAHLGNPYFSELRDLMRTCPNVYTDISGTVEDSPEEKAALQSEILHFLALPNGIDRLMFGTDFPIQSYEDTIALVETLGGTVQAVPWSCDDNMDAGDPWGIGEDGKAKIYWQNAAKLFHLAQFPSTSVGGVPCSSGC